MPDRGAGEAVDLRDAEAGGGAGGGVLLAADTVVVSGAITAAGAGLASGTWGGTGGQGRIKILTGAKVTKVVKGGDTVTATVETEGGKTQEKLRRTE